MPQRNLLAIAPLVLIACAGPARLSAPGVARAGFESWRGDAVFARAVGSVSAAGYRIRTCDAQLGLLETGTVEFDAPCGGTTCLARQSVKVKLGFRAARVTVERAVYDGASRRWVPDEAATDEAHELVQDIIARARRDDHRPPIDRPCSARLDVSALAVQDAR
jgi:hypothetical protein